MFYHNLQKCTPCDSVKFNKTSNVPDMFGDDFLFVRVRIMYLLSSTVHYLIHFPGSHPVPLLFWYMVMTLFKHVLRYVRTLYTG